MTLGLMLSFGGVGVCVCLTASADPVVRSKVFLAGMTVSLTETSEGGGGSHCALRCNPRGNPSSKPKGNSLESSGQIAHKVLGCLQAGCCLCPSRDLWPVVSAAN